MDNLVHDFCGRLMGVALRCFGSMVLRDMLQMSVFFRKDMQSIYLRSNNSPERIRDCLL